MFLCVKNWHEHQHYRDRTPSWIKLHKRLLDDYEFHLLPVASRALAPLIWLLASEYDEGKIPLDEKKIAFRLHLTVAELKAALNPLIDGEFLYTEQDASKPLAEPEQNASLESIENIDKNKNSKNGASAPKTDLSVWQPSEQDRAYAKQRGLDPDRVLLDVQQWATNAEKKRLKKDPVAFWQGWCRREADKKHPTHLKPTNGAYAAPPSNTDDADMKAQARTIAVTGRASVGVSDHRAREMVKLGYLTDEQARKAGYAA